MLNAAAKLSTKIFADDIEKVPTRDGFGRGSVEAGGKDPRIVVLCADLTESTRAEWFQKEFPERFIEMGIAEQNMAGVAAGMAAAGKIPFITSYAAFNPGRNYEHIRTTIALNQVPVKICGMHAGVSVGPDGATHQMLEDIGLMRMLPGMTVLVPGDAEEARKAVVAAAAVDGPVYIRFGRAATPVFTTSETPFQIGKSLLLWESDAPKVAFLSTGSLAHAALMAARALSAEGIESIVLHMPTVKPLDEAMVLAVAKRAGRVVTIEEHQAAGGFGSAVAEFLSQQHPVPMRLLGVADMFGQSGTPDELLSHYGLDAVHIKEAAQALVAV
ncbi:MAG: transketolase C-terminal domain-containing protein [bacterium]|nr:transketolase C-terminal domain-containing protein [bacterium]MDO8741928.1 transketolase C-terminal domain-containing protein [bacterium]